jgi:carbon-monoxide dehydrogenase small subunit
MMPIALTVNGKDRVVVIGPNVTLLEALREELLLTGAKEGCGVGECGACIVLVDGRAVTSCLMLAVDAVGRIVETVEGIAPDGILDAVQEAFVEAGAFQCGYCTPATVLIAEALLRGDPGPSIDDTKDALDGVLCRCGAQPKVLQAIASLAEERT